MISSAPREVVVPRGEVRQHIGAEEPAEPVFLAMLRWLCLIVSVVILILFMDRGYDLTDESYYVAWTVDPSRYAASIHPFGLPQHLIYTALGQSLVALRYAGLTALLGSGLVLGWRLAEYYGDTATRARRAWMPSCALFSLSYYGYWGSTPNYNLMVDVAAALIVAGSLGWASPERSMARRWSSSCLIGLGGCLAFFAKPTSAGIMALGAATLLIATRRRRSAGDLFEKIAVAGLACLGPLAIIIISTTGIAPFVRSLQTGLSVLDFGNGIGSLPIKTIKDLFYSSPLIWINVTLAPCLAMSRRSYASGGMPKGIGYVLAAVLAADMLMLAWSVLNGIRIGAAPWLQLGVPCLCLTITNLCYAISYSPDREIPFRVIAPALALMLLPFVIAFGSAISILPQTGMALFAMFASSLILSRILMPGRAGIVVQAVALAAVPLIISWSSFFPHNLVAPLYRQTEAARLPFSSGLLYVDPASKRYIDALRAVATREELSPGTPVVDLSGGGPGTVLILGGRAPVYPWIFQSLGDPKPLVEATWASLSTEQKSRSWIIGPIDPAFADTRAAADIRRRAARYRRVGVIPMPVGRRILPLSIWKPASR